MRKIFSLRLPFLMGIPAIFLLFRFRRLRHFHFPTLSKSLSYISDITVSGQWYFCLRPSDRTVLRCCSLNIIVFLSFCLSDLRLYNPPHPHHHRVFQVFQLKGFTPSPPGDSTYLLSSWVYAYWSTLEIRPNWCATGSNRQSPSLLLTYINLIIHFQFIFPYFPFINAHEKSKNMITGYLRQCKILLYALSELSFTCWNYRISLLLLEAVQLNYKIKYFCTNPSCCPPCSSFPLYALMFWELFSTKESHASGVAPGTAKLVGGWSTYWQIPNGLKWNLEQTFKVIRG